MIVTKPRKSKKFLEDVYKVVFILINDPHGVDNHKHIYEVSYLGEEFSGESIIIDFWLISCDHLNYPCRTESKPFIHRLLDVPYKLLNPKLAKALYSKEISDETRARLVNGISKTNE